MKPHTHKYMPCKTIYSVGTDSPLKSDRRRKYHPINYAKPLHSLDHEQDKQTDSTLSENRDQIARAGQTTEQNNNKINYTCVKLTWWKSLNKFIYVQLSTLIKN